MKTSCGKYLNLVHYFLYDVKILLLAHSWSFLANRKARNAIVGAENLLNGYILRDSFEVPDSCLINRVSVFPLLASSSPCDS